jgi:sugar phosphate isomerase/epimerase
MLDDLNLRVGSVAFPTRRGYSNPVDLQPRLEATRAAMQLASRLGARLLIGNLGTLTEEENSSAQATLFDAVQSLASFGDRLGVQLAVQSAAPANQLSGLIADLPAGTMALDLHPARLIMQGDSPSEFVRVVGPYIAHVHAVDGVHDLARGHGGEVELGRGTADFPELLGRLEEYGYRDWLTIGRSGSPQPVVEIGNAVKYLRAL